MHRRHPASLLILVFTMLACTISLVETPPASGTYVLTQAVIPTATASPGPIQTTPPTELPAAVPTTTMPSGSSGITPGSPSGPYGVILVAANDVLNLRAGPGVQFGVISSFQPTYNNVMRTGSSSTVGGDLWVEVGNPLGANGWVNAYYLTEYVPSSTFCADPQVTALVDQLANIIINSNGNALAALVSPLHGLNVRQWRHGTVANYDATEARFVFESTYELSWGPAPGSGQDTIGTFSEVPLPNLREVLSAPYERHCNDSLDLATFSLEPWPVEYTNINYYTLYKPGSPGVDLDWRAWLAGIEYVQGQPYLFALIHFQWEP